MSDRYRLMAESGGLSVILYTTIYYTVVLVFLKTVIYCDLPENAFETE